MTLILVKSVIVSMSGYSPRRSNGSSLLHGHVPFTGLPQTLEVLPWFPALLWRCCRGLLCWEVEVVVTRWCRLGNRERGLGQLWGRDAPLEQRDYEGQYSPHITGGSGRHKD